jgi:hypothetical protein
MLDQQFSVVQAATSSVGSDQTTKALLARKLNELIDHRGLNQAAVADITGMFDEVSFTIFPLND